MINNPGLKCGGGEIRAFKTYMNEHISIKLAKQKRKKQLLSRPEIKKKNCVLETAQLASDGVLWQTFSGRLG